MEKTVQRRFRALLIAAAIIFAAGAAIPARSEEVTMAHASTTIRSWSGQTFNYSIDGVSRRAPEGGTSSVEVTIKRGATIVQRIDLPHNSGVGAEWIRVVHDTAHLYNVPIVFLLHGDGANSYYTPVLYVNGGNTRWVAADETDAVTFADNPAGRELSGGLKKGEDTNGGVIDNVTPLDPRSSDPNRTKDFLITAHPCEPGMPYVLVVTYEGLSEAEGAGPGARPHIGDYLQFWSLDPKVKGYFRLSRGKCDDTPVYVGTPTAAP